MSPSADPHPPPSSLFFRPATPAEKMLCWTRNFTSWAAPLQRMADYYDREIINGTQKVTGPDNIIYWVLTSQPTPPAAGAERDEDIIAAAETMRRRVILWTRDAGYANGYSYGIASVFTDPGRRGRGYATLMVERLAAWLDEQDVRFSALYSDIGRVSLPLFFSPSNGRRCSIQEPSYIFQCGPSANAIPIRCVKKFYHARGWIPFPSDQLVLSIPPSPSASSVPDLPPTTPLHKSDLERLCALDVQSLEAYYQSLDSTTTAASAHIAFLPTFDLACWHFGTEEHVGRIMCNRVPTIKGAALDDTCFLYWTHDFNYRHLVILRLVCHNPPPPQEQQQQPPTPHRLAALLTAAIHEASTWHFSAVVIWNPSPDMQRAADLLCTRDTRLSCKLETRNVDSIPSLRWRRNEPPSAPSSATPGDDVVVVWDASEKFAWC